MVHFSTGGTMNNKRQFLSLLIFTIPIFLLYSCQKTEKKASPFPQLKKGFILELNNSLESSLPDHGVVIDLEELLAAVPDFNPRNCAFTDSQGNPLLFQADDIDGNGRPDELAFCLTLPPGKSEIIGYYSPTGTQLPDFPAKTYARLAWEPADANIGWESNRAAYRFYWGQIEAFGKLDERLVMANFTADYKYHEMQDWGMDILHVGEASGLGGISLWEGDNRISTINPAGKGPNQYLRKVIAAGPIRAVARVDIQNIGPANAQYKITLVMSAFTNNIYSRQDIRITSTASGEIIYSPGVEKLADETYFMNPEKGYLASWGQGAPGAGEIGLAVIFNPAEFVGFAENELDRYVKLAIPAGKKRTFWVCGGWHLGITAPESPPASNWARKIKEMSARLLAPLTPKIKKK